MIIWVWVARKWTWSLHLHIWSHKHTYHIPKDLHTLSHTHIHTCVLHIWTHIYEAHTKWFTHICKHAEMHTCIHTQVCLHIGTHLDMYCILRDLCINLHTPHTCIHTHTCATHRNTFTHVPHTKIFSLSLSPSLSVSFCFSVSLFLSYTQTSGRFPEGPYNHRYFEQRGKFA